jgi:hypothetical protein
MTAFNTVRFRVKPGKDQQFLDAHKDHCQQLARSQARQHHQDRRRHLLSDCRVARHGCARWGTAQHDRDAQLIPRHALGFRRRSWDYRRRCRSSGSCIEVASEACAQVEDVENRSKPAFSLALALALQGAIADTAAFIFCPEQRNGE